MGLDAHVCCNCYEHGKISSPPPFPDLVRLSAEGRPEIYSDDDAKVFEHDRWENAGPCPHDNFVLIHEYIGNITRVGNLRDQIERLAGNDAKIILSEILYSGTHCGDFLEVDKVRDIAGELEIVERNSVGETGIDEERITYFIAQMNRLVEASLKLQKPIAF